MYIRAQRYVTQLLLEVSIAVYVRLDSPRTDDSSPILASVTILNGGVGGAVSTVVDVTSPRLTLQPAAPHPSSYIHPNNEGDRALYAPCQPRSSRGDANRGKDRKT